MPISLKDLRRQWLEVVAILVLAAVCPLTFVTAQTPSTHAAQNGGDAGPDLSAIDQSVSPCQDFYKYACGSWMKSHTIPPDQPWWGRFSDMFSDNDVLLRNIMEHPEGIEVKNKQVSALVGSYYQSCMTEAGLDNQGSVQLQKELRLIRSVSSRDERTQLVARLHSLGIQAFFGLRPHKPVSGQSANLIAEIDAGGLTLPGRDYYLGSGSDMAGIREKFVQHMTTMFVLSGDTRVEAEKEARSVLTTETLLANAALDHAARRDPVNVNHEQSIRELGTLFPALSWDHYFHLLNVVPGDRVNVAEPDFFKQLNAFLNSDRRELIYSYLRWRVIDFFSPVLSGSFAAQNFEFREKALNGRTEVIPRWKKCVQLVNEELGDAVGELYVEETLQSEGKSQMLRILEAEKKVLLEDIRSSSWMSAETRQNAIAKLNAMIQRIGYPDQWRDYSALHLSPGKFFENYAGANQFVTSVQLAKIGKPQSSSEWTISPQTIDASYSPEENSLNFPAGILRAPFYSNSADLAVNFAAIGAVIGHELTHGFDDEGRRFDLRGNLRDWWTVNDSRQFEDRKQCFVKQYSSFEVLPGLMANGKLTVGENIADNGGLRIAHSAWADTVKSQPPSPPERSSPERYSDDQKFFLTYAQLWCQNMREPYIRQRTLNNEHSLGPMRVNGVVQNMPEFSDAFSCKATDKMVSRPSCRIW